MVIGWDPGLETFFSQVYEAGTQDDVPIVDTGNRRGENPSPTDLKPSLKGYYELTPGDVEDLMVSKIREGGREHKSEWMNRFLDKNGI